MVLKPPSFNAYFLVLIGFHVNVILEGCSSGQGKY